MGFNYQSVPISKLKAAGYNPRIITSEEFDGLKASIQTFGLVDPIIVNKDFTVIGGHQRLQACKQLGYKEVACNVLDLEEHEEKKLNVLLNSQAISGKYDENLLSEILEELKLDVDYFDLRLDQLEPLDLSEPEEVEEDGGAGELPVVPKTVLGDLYELNGHRLHCADSTSVDAVEKLMNGKKADMVFTDPPYGYKYESNYQKNHDMLLNDDVILDFLPVAYAVTNTNTPFYVFCGWQTLGTWIEKVQEQLELKNIIVWKKNNWSMGDLMGAYAGQYEVILFAHKGRIELLNGRGQDIWEFDREPPKDHPTMKPLDLIARALTDTTKKGYLVLDLFLGSGSTLIACEQTNRTCYGQELDPKYCDVIVKRWAKYMRDKGKEFTVKLNGVEIDVEEYFSIEEKEQVNG